MGSTEDSTELKFGRMYISKETKHVSMTSFSRLTTYWIQIKNVLN